MTTELDAQTVSSLAQVRQQLRINWYRCPIDRAQLCALSCRSDVSGLLQVGGHLGLVVATGMLCWVLYLQQQWYWLLVALFLHGTIAIISDRLSSRALPCNRVSHEVAK